MALFREPTEGMKKVAQKKRETSARRGPKPTKRMRLVESVRNGIAKGRFLPGTALPHRTWYMEKFGITRSTVQEAFDQLAEEGFTVAVRHKGTSVAQVPPFQNRFLLALCGTVDQPAPYAFDRALQTSARQLERDRGVTFDIRCILDEGPNSEAFDAVLSDLRRQRYSGAFLRALAEHRGLDTIGNVDNVPITGFFRRVDRSRGSLVHPLLDSQDLMEAVSGQLPWLLAECQRAGKRSVLVVANDFEGEGAEERVRKQVAFHGLHCGPYGYLMSGIEPHQLRQLHRIFKLILAPSSRYLPDAIVLDDDNFLAPLEAALRDLYGAETSRAFFVVSCANRPLLPPTGLPVRFHGVDTLATLTSFIDWAESVHHGHGADCLPRIVWF